MSFGIIILFVLSAVSPITTGINIRNSILRNDGNTLYVGGNGSGNYTTIQSAIDNASVGDTVFVYDDSSPYNEWNIVINKSINLIGEDRDTTYVIGNHITIEEDGNGVNISGFNLYDTGIMTMFVDNIVISDNYIIEAGISFEHTDNSYIISNTFNDCYFSIYNKGKNNRISNNIFSYSLFEEYSWEIYCLQNNHIITNNTFINYNREIVRDGIMFDFTYSDGSIIEYNEFDGYTSAISGGSFNLISYNTFKNNPSGIDLGGDSNRIIKNNFLKNQKDARSFILKSNNIFDCNYWDEWIGLKIPILSFLPYFSFTFLGSFIDWHPAKEPYNYTTTQGCGII